MLRFELEAIVNNEVIHINCICQNAETVKVVDKQGVALPVVDIKINDEVLVHIGPGATHFGTAVQEKIVEK